MNTFDKIQACVKHIQDKYAPQAKCGIILGTGLGALVNDIEITHSILYSELPHFPEATVEFHAGRLIIGKLSGKDVIVMQGRFHYYEGYSMEQVVFPVRVMKLLGVDQLFISNAAGALNPAFRTSDVMIIEDHINLQYENPLTGANIDELGPRFPDMFEPYDQSYIALAHEIGKEHNLNLHEGVYASVPGPNLETRAEYRYLRTIGADAVGMSTVPEVIAAVHCNMKVFAVSVLTDMCTPEALKPVNIKDILDAAAIAEPKMTLLFKELIKKI